MRNRNYRQGDLAEGLGLEILRRVCFVAPIPRTEDVGLDGICTLHEQKGSGSATSLVPTESSFAVQVKAASTREFSISRARLEWWHDFELPLFVLSVDLKQAMGAVYSLLNLYAEGRSWVGGQDGGVKVVLDPPPGGALMDAQPWVAALPPDAKLWAGHPILEFVLSEIDTPHFALRARTALRMFTAMGQNFCRWRRAGAYWAATWDCGGLKLIHSRVRVGTGDQAAAARAFFS